MIPFVHHLTLQHCELLMTHRLLKAHSQPEMISLLFPPLHLLPQTSSWSSSLYKQVKCRNILFVFPGMKWHHAAPQTIKIDAGRLALKIDILLPDQGHGPIQDPARRRPLLVCPPLKTLQHQCPHQLAEGVHPQLLHPLLCYARLCSVEGVHHIRTYLHGLSEAGQALEHHNLTQTVNKENRL